MSKFKVIDGSNVTSIAVRDREIRALEREIQRKTELTDRDLVVFAYHFVRLQHPLLAQKYLNRVASNYFDSGIYKDLFHGLLVWSIAQVNPHFKQIANHAAYEYFIIVKRAVTMFEDVNFQTKPAFFRFKKEFLKYSEFTTQPPSAV